MSTNVGPIVAAGIDVELMGDALFCQDAVQTVGAGVEPEVVVIAAVTLSDPPQASWIAAGIDESGGVPQYVVVTGPAGSLSWANGGPVGIFYDENGNPKLISTATVA